MVENERDSKPRESIVSGHSFIFEKTVGERLAWGRRMKMENVEVIKRELSSTVELVKRVIAKYRDRYPSLWENYTLVLLLCERESGIWISPDAIESASKGTLPKLNTLDRALRVVKKLYQTKEARKRSSELESAYASVLGGDWGDDTVG